MIKSIDQARCVGCGECDLACPMDVIYLNEEVDRSEIRYREHCQTCFNCELACSTGAIYVDPAKKPKVQPW